MTGCLCERTRAKIDRRFARAGARRNSGRHGFNRHIDLPGKMLRHIEQRTGIAFLAAKNHFEAQGGKDAVVEASGHLKTIAVSLFKIANDIRWLGSGPRCGIGEIQLPETQPGSSIMPGKVNPVMCESVMMVSAQVFGNDTTITWAGANGNFELNVMMPVMAHNLPSRSGSLRTWSMYSAKMRPRHCCEQGTLP